MRTIKYKVWDGEKMHDNLRIYWDADNLNDCFEKEQQYEKRVFLQFTGLLDTHGREVYEGHIIECQQMQGLGKLRGIVHFGTDWRKIGGFDVPDSRLYLDTRPFQKNNGSEFCIFHGNPEIIGNIYENPSLLTPTEVIEKEI